MRLDDDYVGWMLHDLDTDTADIMRENDPAIVQQLRDRVDDLELYRDRLSLVIDRLRRREAA